MFPDFDLDHKSKPIEIQWVKCQSADFSNRYSCGNYFTRQPPCQAGFRFIFPKIKGGKAKFVILWLILFDLGAFISKKQKSL